MAQTKVAARKEHRQFQLPVQKSANLSWYQQPSRERTFFLAQYQNWTIFQWRTALHPQSDWNYVSCISKDCLVGSHRLIRLSSGNPPKSNLFEIRRDQWWLEWLGKRNPSRNFWDLESWQGLSFSQELRNDWRNSFYGPSQWNSQWALFLSESTWINLQSMPWFYQL